MISIHIEGQTPDEIKGILAGLASHYAEPAPAAPKPAKVAGNSPVPAPAAADAPTPAPKTDEMPKPAPKTDELPAIALKMDPTPLHTRDSVRAMIKAANLPKTKTVEMLKAHGAKSVTEMPDDKLQAFGDAVAELVKAAPAETLASGNSPVPEPAPTPAAPAAPTGEVPFTRETVMPVYVDAAAHNRPALVAALASVGAAKLSAVADDKINEIGQKMKAILAGPKAAA